MPVSIKPSPIIKGEGAKKINELRNNPADKTLLWDKCKELSKIFETIN